MSNLTILGRFQVVRRRLKFLAHLRKNTATSVANEPVCRHFDPLTPDAGLGTPRVIRRTDFSKLPKAA